MRLRAGSRFLLGVLLLASALSVWARAPRDGSDRTLTVFAAASLSEAFREIGRAFERAHPGTRVSFNFAASSLLRAQIEQGAPADLFASADGAQLAPLARAGRVRPPQTFARNLLVIVTPAANPGQIEHPRDLARPGLRLVITAPQVPIGRYTRQALAEMSGPGAFGTRFREAVLRNVVSQEPNARGLLSKVLLGEADAAIVYATDARAGGARARVIPLPSRCSVTAVYPAAVVAGSPREQKAARFLAFLRSPEGRAILKRHGFQ